MTCYLYVIRSGSEQYIGTTKDLHDRLKRHNAGHCKATKHAKAWSVIHFERYETLSSARKREQALKKAKRKFTDFGG